MDGTTYYAIGDVHGEAALLAALIAQILQDADGQPTHIILLGDLIDRGPDSRGAVDLVMSLQRDPPTRARVTALKGNHEAMMLDALSAPGSSKPKLWLRNGGRETWASYGISEHAAAEVRRDTLPSEHVAWLSALANEHAEPRPSSGCYSCMLELIRTPTPIAMPSVGSGRALQTFSTARAGPPGRNWRG